MGADDKVVTWIVAGFALLVSLLLLWLVWNAPKETRAHRMQHLERIIKDFQL